MNEFDWSFLRSTRFYGNLAIAIGTWLQMPNPLSLPGIGSFLIAFGGLFVVTGTVDRITDRVTQSSKIKTEEVTTEVTNPAGTVKESNTTKVVVSE